MTRFRRLLAYLQATPVIEAVSPEIVDDLHDVMTRHGIIERHRDADEIVIAARGAAVFDLAAERHQRLAQRMTEPPGALIGPAFTFTKGGEK